ncbi:MAG: glycosyltransferase family 4 protein [Candidatus Altiarchaeales archaeon]|nr:glycosyltransferase family 4 protein [Candidatus Altiarchaeales archaeon]
MKILFSGDGFLMPAGGAVKSMRTLLELLAEKNEVHAVFCGKENRDYKEAGMMLHERKMPCVFKILKSTPKQWLLNRWWRGILQNVLKEKFDLVFTQQVLTPSTVKAAKKSKTKVVCFIRDYYPLCLTTPREGCGMACFNCLPLAKKLIYPISLVVRRGRLDALRESDLVIANSDYMSRFYEECAQVKSRVIYPVIKGRYTPARGGDRIGFITKAGAEKGIKIFLEIARNLDRKYLLVGNAESYEKEVKALSNVEYVPWTDNMQSIYAKLKIVLVPSQLPDSSPRVCIEAMRAGIPVIASKIGGIPELVGDAGILVGEYSNPQAWVEEIKKLESNPKIYNKISEKSLRRAGTFSAEEQLARFRGIIREELNIEL